MSTNAWGQLFIQSTAPAEDPAKIGSLWADTSGTATLKICTATGPYTFAAISGGGGTSPLTNEGRLTLTSGTPVTTSDVTGATTVYWTPFIGNRISLFDGSSTWTAIAASETSLALGTLSSGKPYDVFGYNNSGALALELLAWTDDTTRATALTTQDGVLVKSGATTRRYLGSFYTTATTTTEDSMQYRYLYNANNRVPRRLFRYDSTASYTYTTATVRQARADTNNQVGVMVGNPYEAIQVGVTAAPTSSTTGYGLIGVGEDSTTAISSDCISPPGQSGAANILAPMTAFLIKTPPIGRHLYVWLEWAQATGTMTWFNSGWGPGSTKNSGLTGWFFA